MQYFPIEDIELSEGYSSRKRIYKLNNKDTLQDALVNKRETDYYLKENLQLEEYEFIEIMRLLKGKIKFEELNEFYGNENNNFVMQKMRTNLMKAKTLLYQHYHQTEEGIKKTIEDSKRCKYGRCSCNGKSPLYPISMTSVPFTESIKLFCYDCNQIFKPKGKLKSLDGAIFGKHFLLDLKEALLNSSFIDQLD
ncbi:casein kinase ii subunit beta [Anaeramoeba flamelloides]|uniref:Casein kinase II subunit beta n=1 Tax=Anaeramoeba flamelloides TaxID=1746091 RepID=A0ABQ8XTH3_9EUKA|nr:casein kinase ii subunit beta [Anaeramoeba flamelloides]